MEAIGARIDPDIDASRLTMPQQQLVEIAKALAAEARVLILDEPTASLSDTEIEHLFTVISRLKNQGVGVIYISHRLDELPRIADRVTALRDGRLVGTAPLAEVTRADLIRMMVGRDLAAIFPKTSVPIGSVLLETRGLSCSAGAVHGVDLSVHAGEIVGLAGLVGAGRTELARILFGLTPADSGEIVIRGNRVIVDSPARAVALGIAYVPEDRRRHGVILDLSVAANTSLALLPKMSRRGLFDFSRERELAGEFVSRLGVKTASVDMPVGNLSGGNQQKIALARWLATHPVLLILDEPTQGIDVASKAEIHRLMGELAARGLGILMISSDLPEILRMSDRIAVMHAGTIVGALDRAEATQERVMEMALGHGDGGRPPALEQSGGTGRSRGPA
jgi:rhamnose transport system ATP-binding protein